MMNTAEQHHHSDDPQTMLKATLEHLEHLLPGQGPILDFVHHNTIHGFQQLPFFEALAAYERLTGIHGFQPESTHRANYRQGRITDADLDAVLEADKSLQAASLLCMLGERRVNRQALYRAVMLHGLPALNPAQLQWQLGNGGLGAQSALWHGILERLGLDGVFPDVEDYTAPESNLNLDSAVQRANASTEVEATFARVGVQWSLRTLVLQVTGTDILDSVRPQLIRLCASLLDEGLASWHVATPQTPGLWQSWRALAAVDLHPVLLEQQGARALLQRLSDDPWLALEQLLLLSGVPRERWAGYLERCALELPGWAGLINWRQRRPQYHTDNPGLPRLEDFLALRLTLDKLELDKVCRERWHCDSDHQSLLSHFRLNPEELQGRLLWQSGALPEYLTRQAEALSIQMDTETPGHLGWPGLALQIEHWRRATAQADNAVALAQGQAWQLFCLCQHLGISAAALATLPAGFLPECQLLVATFDANTRGRLWLQAYERHYRDEVFTALAANRERGGWLQRSSRPEAQIVMCMDEREESFRRNLEELNPQIETLGAAGFFGIPMQYQGLDSRHSTPLCPVVVTPAHKVDEVARAGQEAALQGHRKGWARLQLLVSTLHQRLRLNPVLAWLVIVLGAPVLGVVLLLDSLLPGVVFKAGGSLRALFVPAVSTELKLVNEDNARDTSGLHAGFTFKEQSERVAGLLRTLGLINNFAPIVAFAGHGSTSQNNPHEAAHDCGACGGHQGGPNARAFAAMANRVEVRTLLAAQGIVIPADCWFVGMQHDTCNDLITWYDTDLVPAVLRARFETFRETLFRAQQLSAHERSRRFATARNARTPASAYRHVTLRAQDLSQVRPEYGHATNACAVIGRRQLTQGVFFDRRLFLISYDPSTDREGRILENILLTAGPVGAGINLEYYFSTIDNERFGCGTKIPHNVMGLCAVMEGASSDLRTGLPLQMVEIHEAMRLQVIVEAKLDVVARIYGDQPALQELIGGGWLLVSVVDPDTGGISVFDPAEGFVSWEAQSTDLPVRDLSLDCYRGIDTPIAPMLIRQPALGGVS